MKLKIFPANCPICKCAFECHSVSEGYFVCDVDFKLVRSGDESNDR